MLQVADFGIRALEVNERAGELNPLPSKTLVNAYSNVDAIHQAEDAEGNTESYSLNMTEESDGTNSYFSLIGIVKKVLESGELFVVDEMDFRSGHFPPRSDLVYGKERKDLSHRSVFTV